MILNRFPRSRSSYSEPGFMFLDHVSHGSVLENPQPPDREMPYLISARLTRFDSAGPDGVVRKEVANLVRDSRPANITSRAPGYFNPRLICKSRWCPIPMRGIPACRYCAVDPFAPMVCVCVVVRYRVSMRALQVILWRATSGQGGSFPRGVSPRAGGTTSTRDLGEDQCFQVRMLCC